MNGAHANSTVLVLMKIMATGVNALMNDWERTA